MLLMQTTHKPSVILKFGRECLFLFFSFIFLMVGSEDIQHSAADAVKAARYPTPVTLTYDEFVHRHPQEGWFRITGGVLDLVSATATKRSLVGDAKTFGVTMTVEAPLRRGKNIRQNPIYIAVSSQDGKLCEAWSHLYEVQLGIADDVPKADASKSEDVRIRTYAAQHPEKWLIDRDVEGILKPGTFSDMRETSLTSTPPDMAEDYVVLKDGTTGADYKEHNATRGIVMVTLIALFWGWRVWRMVSGWRKRLRKQYTPAR